MQTNPPNTDDAWLVGGGEMADFILAKDWSKTPLGPTETWPQSLRTVVSLMQASKSPMSMAWGSDHSQIYNDGYWPICGDKHPTSMGQDFRECWASAFPVIREAYETAWAGKTSYLRNMRMFLERYGFPEETWFTFSFSPITDETGAVGGVFHPVTEMTVKMLDERRTKALRDLAQALVHARTTPVVYDAVAEALSEDTFDVPFVACFAQDDGRMLLQSQSGIPARHPARDSATWPLDQVDGSGEARCIEELDLEGLGPYPEPPSKAWVMPVFVPGQERPEGIVVLGVSPRLAMDDAYEAFMERVAVATSSGLANARAYEDEQRKRMELAEIDRAKTAFFSNVSHEFRTPLTLMLGPLEDELNENDDPLPGARRDRLVTAHRNSLRLLKLVNSLLDFSRVESGMAEVRRVPTALTDTTKEIASMFGPAIERAGLKLHVRCADVGTVNVDVDMWEKVVLNLLSNALKHTFEGSITVALEPVDDGVRLRVTDTGKGIAESQQEKVFERFHRVVDQTARSHEGSGVGLALVKDMIESHGGRVGLKSRLGAGATFDAWVPIGEPDAEASDGHALGAVVAAYLAEADDWTTDDRADARAATRDEPTPVEQSASEATVLVVDDNRDMRQYLARMLDPHFRVVTANDGLDALERIAESRPDLVLSDVMMPNLDGVGLVKRLRSQAETATIPCIFVSARAGEEASIQGLEEGADDYIVKPFVPNEVIARVRAAIKSAGMREESRVVLQEAHERLQEASREKARFFSMMSHELRSPVIGLIGFTELLVRGRAGELNEEQQEMVNKIKGSATAIGRLVDDILDLAKADIGAMLFHAEDVSLKSVVQDTMANIEAVAEAKHLDVVLDVADETVHLDPRRTEQMMLNYLSNAVRHSPEAGKLTVTATVRGGRLRFSVKDEGSGISKDQQDRLFQDYVQLEPGSRGSGLGLALVAAMCKQLGGTYGVQSQVGKGSTFWFETPLQ